MSQTQITISAAILLNDCDEMLLVRKRGTQAFMQPGGKIDAGETPSEALTRELSEEIALHADADRMEYLGVHAEVAANEPDACVIAHTFAMRVTEPVTPAAEIEDARWVALSGEIGLELAPLTENRMFPLARKFINDSAALPASGI
ncbi:MAG: NUDIX domain-containing protein [Rhizobiaceae bacterium]